MKAYWSKFKENINFWNAILTLLFSFSLVVVAVLQYSITVKQTKITEKQTVIAEQQTDIASNANKLAQYEYRFQFYNDLETLIENNSIIEREPQLEDDEYIEMSQEIVSLIRESKYLFEGKTYQMLNDVLTKHLQFLMDLYEKDMYYDDYVERMHSLLKEYSEVLSSPELAEYLDINKIN